MDAAGSVNARTDLPGGGCFARCCEDGATAASGTVPGARSPSSHPHLQGYGGGQLMLPAWPPARAGRKTGGEFVLQSRARELLQCPFSLSLHSLCRAKTCGAADRNHGRSQGPCIPSHCGKASADINVQMGKTAEIFTSVCCIYCRWNGNVRGVAGEGVLHGRGCPPRLCAEFVRTTSLGRAAQEDF